MRYTFCQISIQIYRNVHRLLSSWANLDKASQSSGTSGSKLMVERIHHGKKTVNIITNSCAKPLGFLVTRTELMFKLTSIAESNRKDAIVMDILNCTSGFFHILFELITLFVLYRWDRHVNSSITWISKCFNDKEYHLCFHLTYLAVAFLFQCFRDRHLGIVLSIYLYEGFIFSNVSSGNSLDTRISFALKEFLFLGQGFSIGRFMNRKSYSFENNIAHFYIGK